MQVFIASFLSIFVFSISANDFGAYTERAKIHLQEERVKDLISQAKQSRDNIENSRDIATFSPQDKKWAQEFDTLMADESEVDYLEKAAAF